MYKVCLGLLFSVNLFPAVFDYNLHMSFKRGPTPYDPRSETKLNDETKLCACGQPPVFVMFFYGNPEFYCINHIPQIEHVRPIAREEIEELMESIEIAITINGGHDGK